MTRDDGPRSRRRQHAPTVVGPGPGPRAAGHVLAAGCAGAGAWAVVTSAGTLDPVLAGLALLAVALLVERSLRARVVLRPDSVTVVGVVRTRTVPRDRVLGVGATPRRLLAPTAVSGPASTITAMPALHWVDDAGKVRWSPLAVLTGQLGGAGGDHHRLAQVRAWAKGNGRLRREHGWSAAG